MTKKILIAEDDEDILLILNMVLTDAGYNVETLTDGCSIVDRKSGWPDLFILDKDMPVIDGLALSRYLKLNAATHEIPIIMISAFHNLKGRAKKAGVTDFIEKPFEVKNLLHVIGKYIDLKSNDKSLV